MYSPQDTAEAVGFPIRKFQGQRVLAPYLDLSQRATSFIASARQGIHQMPLKRLITLIVDIRPAIPIARARKRM